MVIDCVNCKFSIKGEVLAEYDIDRSDDPIEAVKYYFVKCPQCMEPVVMKSNRFFEFNSFDWAKPEKIFPIEEFHVNPVIPEALRNALVESIKCYRAGSYTGTAIMCRRTIEGFCKLKGISENNLLKSLQKLKENGEIPIQIYEWADELRLSGNEAAHNINSTFTAIDAKDILDFTIAILDFAYSFKDKFDKYKERNRETGP